MTKAESLKSEQIFSLKTYPSSACTCTSTVMYYIDKPGPAILITSVRVCIIFISSVVVCLFTTCVYVTARFESVTRFKSGQPDLKRVGS